MVENDASAEHTAMERVTVDARGCSAGAGHHDPWRP